MSDAALQVRGVLIDLDGTLVDTLDEFRQALDGMRAALSLGPVNAHDVRQWVGRGSEYLVQQALAADWSPKRVEAELGTALELYYQYYALANGTCSALYPGVTEGLAALKDMGMVLACVTNKPRHFAVPLLERFGILEHFALVLGGDAGAPKKPDPALFLAAAAQLQLSCDDLIAIGDSVNDVGAARGAHMRVLLVPYGYNHGQPVQQAGADGIVLSLLDGAHWILSNNRAPENRSTP